MNMNGCLLTLRSATYAMRAQAILVKNGIGARTVKLDGEFSSKGCTHGIRFDCRSRGTVERLLQENGISYSDIRGQ